MDEKSIEQKRFLGENTPAEAVRLGTALLESIPKPFVKLPANQADKQSTKK